MARRPKGGEWDDQDDISDALARKRFAGIQREKETREHGFGCDHCKQWAIIDESIGTHNRNHCPSCLWSKHMDGDRPGDRKSTCRQGMKPIALTFKGEARDKFVSDAARNAGELMLVHECVAGDMVRINRIAADDNTDALIEVYEQGHDLPLVTQELLVIEGIEVASAELSGIVMTQLFGRGGQDFR